MDANVYCACGHVPTRFCTCQKPQKVYLCDICTGSHLSKRGNHPLFQVEVDDLLDPDLQNLRSRKAIEFLAKLEEVKNTVLKEWHEVDTTVREMYQEECGRLWKVYEEAERLTYEVYQEAWNGLNKAEKEIKLLETTMNVQLSKESFAVISLSCHSEKQTTEFLNLRNELSKAFQGQKITSFEANVSVWSCSSDSCAFCSKTLQELHIKQVVGNENLKEGKELGGSWTCPQCRNINAKGQLQCSKCSFASLVKVENLAISEEVQNVVAAHEQPAVVVQGELACWQCGRCRYKHNLKSFEVCSRCKDPNPVRKVPAAGSGNKVEFNELYWTCPKCTYEYNFKEKDGCQKCGFTKIQVVVAKPDAFGGAGQQFIGGGLPLFPQLLPWTCMCGNSESRFPKCGRCGKQKSDQPSHLGFQGTSGVSQFRRLQDPQLQESNASWKCKVCDHEGNISTFCTTCQFPRYGFD